ncbi:MAG: hypothetical protein R3E60_02165 [Alphaproteobacteria bacterium]
MVRSIPLSDETIKGDLPSPVSPLQDASFARTPQSTQQCATETSILEAADNRDHLVACH